MKRRRFVPLKTIAQVETLVAECEEFCGAEPRAFSTSDEALEAAALLFQLREAIALPEQEGGRVAAPDLAERMARRFHETLRQSRSFYLVDAIHERALDELDTEILLLLATLAFGLRSRHQSPFERAVSVNAVATELCDAVGGPLEAIRRLLPESRLVGSGLVRRIDDREETHARIVLDAGFLDDILRAKPARLCGLWELANYEELLDKCHGVFAALAHKADALFRRQMDAGRWTKADSEVRQANRLLWLLEGAIASRPEWPCHALAGLPAESLAIVVTLLGKELRYATPENDLFSGEGLARVASDAVPDIRRSLGLLRSNAPLIRDGYIRVCGGAAHGILGEDDATLQACEFELTSELLAKLQIKRVRKRSGNVRAPVARLDQLFLSDATRRAIEMILVQARNGDALWNEWGLGGAVRYGRGMVALFAGPPGTGKTATAEALASELGKPILVADYAEIHNCWVGETEKRIVRAFREAAQSDAVLFWDEADAIFAERDAARATWEVRHVNVLLQELERLPGLCILATNRMTALDKALERRVALKVRFERPDYTARRDIWRKLLPESIPLEPGVSVDELAKERLSGGEIRNVILNAARMALCRGPEGPIAEQDFAEALRLEREGRWTGAPARGLGFAPDR